MTAQSRRLELLALTQALAAANLELETERSAIRAEREQAERLGREILAILGHDLRAPIGAILLAAEMLANECTSAASAATLARIVLFTNRMTRMVEQVLDLTRESVARGGLVGGRSGLASLEAAK